MHVINVKGQWKSNKTTSEQQFEGKITIMTKLLLANKAGTAQVQEHQYE